MDKHFRKIVVQIKNWMMKLEKPKKMLRIIRTENYRRNRTEMAEILREKKRTKKQMKKKE